MKKVFISELKYAVFAEKMWAQCRDVEYTVIVATFFISCFKSYDVVQISQILPN